MEEEVTEETPVNWSSVRIMKLRTEAACIWATHWRDCLTDDIFRVVSSQ
jgi:hypothetical protein